MITEIISRGHLWFMKARSTIRCNRTQARILPVQVLMALLAVPALGGQTLINLNNQAKNVDFSSAAYTKPSKTGTTLPASCSVGETYFKTDARPGSNLYGCTATNIWTILSDNLSDTGVSPGVYGAGQQVPQISVDAQGRITSAVNVPLSGATGTAMKSGDLLDCKVVVNGANATVLGPCALATGNTVHQIDGAVVNLAGAGSNGTVYFYWDSEGKFVADEATLATLTCDSGCITAGTGGFPSSSFPVARATFSNGLFTSVEDLRSVFSTRSVFCGAGLACAENQATGEITVSADSTSLVTKSSYQSAQPIRCVSASTSNVHQCSMNPVLMSYSPGMVIEFIPSMTAVSGQATLDIDGLGPKPIKKADGTSAPGVDEISAGQQVPLRYDGTVFRLPASGGGGSTPTTKSMSRTIWIGSCNNSGYFTYTGEYFAIYGEGPDTVTSCGGAGTATPILGNVELNGSAQQSIGFRWILPQGIDLSSIRLDLEFVTNDTATSNVMRHGVSVLCYPEGGAYGVSPPWSTIRTTDANPRSVAWQNIHSTLTPQSGDFAACAGGDTALFRITRLGNAPEDTSISKTYLYGWRVRWSESF